MYAGFVVTCTPIVCWGSVLCSEYCVLSTLFLISLRKLSFSHLIEKERAGCYGHYVLAFICLCYGVSYSRCHRFKNQVGVIRIHHACEVGIERSVSKITNWHHEAC